MKFLFAGMTAVLMTVGPLAATAAEITGSFSGKITPSGCRSSKESTFSGVIANGRVKGMAAKGASFDWEMKPDGKFGGELYLREHKRGKKMQFYDAHIENNKVIVQAKFGVTGYSQTFCSGSGEFILK